MSYYHLILFKWDHGLGDEIRMQEKYWENRYRDMLVCVDGYENQIPTGRLIHSDLGRAVRFRGTVQLLQDVEVLLDDLRFPEPFSRLRSFRPMPEEHLEPAVPTPATGLTATFCLRILFRQNATWQGTVQWLEGRRSMPFRSTLELLFLLDNILLACGEGQVSTIC